MKIEQFLIPIAIVAAAFLVARSTSLIEIDSEPAEGERTYEE
tara:strand:- start:962 stop:1087 length:126 start_codon:yes stop_codon:yes gene_type:complete